MLLLLVDNTLSPPATSSLPEGSTVQAHSIHSSGRSPIFSHWFVCGLKIWISALELFFLIICRIESTAPIISLHNYSVASSCQYGTSFTDKILKNEGVSMRQLKGGGCCKEASHLLLGCLRKAAVNWPRLGTQPRCDLVYRTAQYPALPNGLFHLIAIHPLWMASKENLTPGHN